MVHLVNIIGHHIIHGIDHAVVLRFQSVLDFLRIAQDIVDADGVNADTVINNLAHPIGGEHGGR